VAAQQVPHGLEMGNNYILTSRESLDLLMKKSGAE
jgi:hypothetical protein